MGNPAEAYLIEELSEDEYLAHYASQYYDPKKAREYYLRTRELKGRNSSGDLKTGKKKEAWAVTRSNISNERKAEGDKARTDQQARLESLRKTALEARDRMVEKLQGLIADLKSGVEDDIAKKREELANKLESRLVRIPDTATPQRRAYLERQNAKIRQQYTETVNTEIQKVQADAREKATAGRKEYTEERKKTSETLRSSLTKARTDYKAAREAAVTKYKAIEDREYSNIKNQA